MTFLHGVEGDDGLVVGVEAALDGGDDRGGGGGGDRHPAAETNTLANLLRAPTECRRENHSNVVAPPPDINRDIVTRKVERRRDSRHINLGELHRQSPPRSRPYMVHIFFTILFLLPVTQFCIVA